MVKMDIKPKRVIFSFFWEGKLMPIMLYVGDRVILDTGRRPDDEGWGRAAAQFDYDGDTVFLEAFSEGRDCDGYLSNCTSMTCLVSDLQAHSFEDEDGKVKRGPLWKRVDEAVCDEQAQQAGY